ncbi:MAG: hypothetical protein GTO22_07205 [Gemmatimonadales bacterium]|nr:hypothetical protein [Gemmatimonadales bacterium]
MGVHEPNQEGGGGWASPGEYFYRVHMEIPLAEGEPGENKMKEVLQWLKTAHEGKDPAARRRAWDALKGELKPRIEQTTGSQNALELLDAVLKDDVKTSREAAR